jgi:hypothetical protein
LLRGDRDLVASRVQAEHVIVVADLEAARSIP